MDTHAHMQTYIHATHGDTQTCTHTDGYTYTWTHHLDTLMDIHTGTYRQTYTQMEGHTQTHRYTHTQMHTWTHIQTHGFTHTYTHICARAYTTPVFHGVTFPSPPARLPLAPGSAPCLSFKLEQVTEHSVSVPSGVERSNPTAFGFAS